MKTSVLKELEARDLKYVKPLGEGSFGDVLLVMSADKEELAVKLVKNENSWLIEETEWRTI